MISERESKIVLGLSEVILGEAVALEVGVNLVAQLDCLLSLAIIGTENNWKKPELVLEGPLGQ